MIVLYHDRGSLGIRGLDGGFVAVDAFFVLSAIVLAMKYTDAIVEGMSFGAFAAARLKRLYPMAFIAGVFVVVLNLLGAAPNLYMIAGPTGVLSIFVPLVPSVGGWTIDTDAAFPADVKPFVSPLGLTMALAAAWIAFANGLPASWQAAFGTTVLGAALLHGLQAAPAPGPAVSWLAKWLGRVSFPLSLVHGPAGRLLPCFPDAWPHSVVLLLLLVPVGAVATMLNERGVRALHQGPRMSEAPAEKGLR